MFCFDIETLDTESSSVILSAAIVYFDGKEKLSYQQYLDRTLFVKFNAVDQIKRLKRTTSKDTMEWWSKQAEYVRNQSIKPKPDDYSAEEGIDKIIQYMNQYEKPREQIMWARGSLDQVVIDSLCKAVDKPCITEYYVWRDVRTAVDIIYGTSNGYCEVDHPDFNRDSIPNHLPYHDICIDVMMLTQGKEKI
jgi:hypothetical protein